MKTLMDVQELQDRMTSGAQTILLDVRWALGDPHGHAYYRSAHIPGAVYVDMETELCGPGAPGLGRHPLPDPDALQEAARQWGLNDGDTVVAYDATGNLAAARLWWLLRNAGFPSVRLLDGGLTAWRAAGFGVEGGDERHCVGSVHLSSGHMPVLSVPDLTDLTSRPSVDVVLDARAGERFRGELEPIDPRAGHIPGAVSAPTSENLGEDGRFRSADELRRRFRELGADRGSVGVYCGSGITAAHEIAALEIAGIEASLFPGSWSQWSTTDGLPVATGA
ncbi:sulfurtransferase [Arthrobacter agilis]|uniref:sulfurtransferase n=1 Tax=Arthrobacter agilis TaxID=37921 RepID=UPI000B3563DA|nr:sulfurtransferase [Arthrobacter agilis]OUM44068.1 sulfurtransferase [Arthrobacter agilis]PPB46444.1 sulfurtransferase [Arthrobacter agilis]TPV23901.1 sulfurtransferase [Arthrobacter agilis]VDR32647.1 3-mercaptopyruvate sulfurtransferase [Arthrobacter agilis]